MTVINVVLFGNSVQTVDAFVPSLEPLLQVHAGSHLLIAGRMKFETRYPQPFFNVHTPFSLGGCLSPLPPLSLGTRGIVLFLLHGES